MADADERVKKYGPVTHRFISDTYHARPDGTFTRIAQRFGKIKIARVKSVPAHVKPVAGGTDDAA